MDTLYDTDRITRWLLPDALSGVQLPGGQRELTEREWCEVEAARIGGSVGMNDDGQVAVYRAPKGDARTV